MELAYGKIIKSCADLEEQVNKINEISKIKEDPVNPDHYKNQTSLECIEAMEIAFGRDAVIDFCRCNAWKYIWRWKNKNGKVDLDKADWYLTKAYDMLSGSDERMTIVRGMIHYVNENRLASMLKHKEIKRTDKYEEVGTGELYPGEFESRHYDFEEDEE